MIRQVAYLVEEKRPALSDLELSDPVGMSVRKSALAMSEQLAFEKCFRDGSHIDRDQCFLLPVGKHMDLAGEHLLAGPVLAGHQNVGVRPGDFFDQGTELLHGVAFAPEHSALFGNDELIVCERNAFAVCRPDIIGRFQCFQQLGVIPGLDHEIGRSFLDAPHGKVDIRVGREKNDLYRSIFLLYFRKPEQPFVAGIDTGTEIHVQ